MAFDETQTLDYVLARIRHFRRYNRAGVIREIRITQAMLGDLVGLTRESVANIENQRQALTVGALCRICWALEVELTDILPALGVSVPQSVVALEWGGEKYSMLAEEADIVAKVAAEKR